MPSPTRRGGCEERLLSSNASERAIETRPEFVSGASADARPRVDIRNGSHVAIGRGRIRELDGVRALAILFVFANHFFANGVTTAAADRLHGFARALSVIAGHGWLGVDLFFVLSGFLITGILLDTRGRSTYFNDFWIRRALRILPLVFVVAIVLSLIFRPPILYTLMAFFFMIDFAGLFHLGNEAMGPLWSLAVEEQFYLIWPILVFVLGGRALAAVAVSIIIVEPIVRALVPGSIDLPWYRMDGLAMGSLIAVFIRSRYCTARTARAGIWGAAVLAGVLLAGELRAHVTSLAFRISEANLLFGAIILAGAAFSGHRLLALFRTRTARFIADISFCAYLIHVPMLLFARRLGIGEAWPNVYATATAQAAFAIILTVCVAALSRRYFELPFQRLKDRFAPAA